MTKLTIILNTYAMQREAPRTLRTMLPSMQKAVSPQEYEILVIDNGSPDPLDLSSVDSGGVDIRPLRVSPDVSHASPVFAMNEAAAQEARGAALLICIDGARMFSPYLIRRTLDALERAPDAVTYVGSRHLGREPQMKAVQNGYDQAAEDALLDSVDWAGDLDRLNEISVWAGAHGRRNAFTQNESNAIGLSKSLWQRIGGYDEGFARSGGGLCNLEMFNRLVERPDARNILLLGESTFHQVHGGAATSHAGYFADSLQEYADAVGAKYALPRYEFEVDKGLLHDREAAIGPWYYK
ncbi:hypothetical protein N9W17_05880 [Jannaschia sp.]|nr:hypothetical protein [Jannaschia sp.]